MGTDQLDRSLPDPHLFRMMNALFQPERIVDDGIELPDRAAVRPHHFSPFRQYVQVGTGRHRGDMKAADDVFDGDLAFFFDYLPDLASSLFS